MYTNIWYIYSHILSCVTTYHHTYEKFPMLYHIYISFYQIIYGNILITYDHIYSYISIYGHTWSYIMNLDIHLWSYSCIRSKLIYKHIWSYIIIYNFVLLGNGCPKTRVTVRSWDWSPEKAFFSIFPT